eukprot:5540888-Amphidinium_carterae.4
MSRGLLGPQHAIDHQRLALGRRPPDQVDLELLNRTLFSSETPEPDLHLGEVNLPSRHIYKRDLAQRVQPSEGPSHTGEKVYFWRQDSSKFKDKGVWVPAMVVDQKGAIVRVETDLGVQTVNQSKLRKNTDPWHAITLPQSLAEPNNDPPRATT